jgi:acetyl esterase/lipase
MSDKNTGTQKESSSQTYEMISKGEINHPLDENDARAVAVMREQTLAFKGQMSGPEARTPFDQIMEHTPDAAGITYETGTVGGVSGVWCRPEKANSNAAILYFHGGGYVFGTAHAYRHLAGQFAARTGVAAFIADYRLAPENPFPAAIDDAQAAYAGLLESGASSIAVVGDSAGGGLTLSLLSILQNDDSKKQAVVPVAAVVMSPWADLAITGRSYEDREDADPIFTKKAITDISKHYLNNSDPRDPLASPMYANLAGLPPIQIHVGTEEVLFDDSRSFANRARAANVDIALHVWEGMPHVFASSVGTLAAAEEALEIMTRFLSAHLSNQTTA